MQFEELLEEVGGFGRYQKLLCFLLIPATTGLVGLTYYAQLFLLAAPPHTCRQPLPVPLLNDTPYESAARQPYACHQHPANASLDANVSALSEVATPSQPCSSGWQYDHTSIFPTLTSQNDWVCDEAWRPYLVVTVFWVGNTVGAWLWGVVSDWRGRRPTVLLSLLVYGAAGTISAFVTNFYGFVLLRFLTGASHHTVTHLPFVLVVEYCGVKSRTVPLLVIMASYTTASVLAPVLAWAVWHWSTILLLTSVPSLLLLLFYRCLPESASWLIARGRDHEARKILETVARVNGRTVPPAALSRLSGGAMKQRAGQQGRASVVAALRYPGLRRNIALVLLIWMLGCLCYYGHCQNTANLGSNIFLSYLLGALVEVPAWGVPWAIQRLGRRPLLVSTFLVSGVAGLLYSVIPQGVEWILLVLALVGRSSITGAYYITLQYCPELFPTVVRGQGVALAETLGGIAIFLSPSIVYLGEYWHTLPLLVLAGLSWVAGAAGLLLPETRGVALPQTLSQADLFAVHTAPVCCRSQQAARKGDPNGDQTASETMLQL